MPNPRSFVVLAGCLSVAMRYALVLSASDRGPVDYAVEIVLATGITWAVWGAVRGLHAAFGLPGVVHVLRVLALWTVTLTNTAWASAAGAPPWRQPLWVALTALAVVDSIALAVREHRAGSRDADAMTGDVGRGDVRTRSESEVE